MRKDERRQIASLAAIIAGLHALGWGGVWWGVHHGAPALAGLAGLAYAFGLRHAFDADHIAAIDNTTRKLMKGERRPLGVGFYFSLGHSTVVFCMTLALAVATQTMTEEMPRFREVGSYVGTIVSGVFLYVIGIMNLVVMIDIARAFRALGGRDDARAMEERLLERGVLTRWFSGVFKFVSKPWHMYPIGVLFGLGFDTATEIGLLTTAAVATTQAMPLLAVLSLPVVFAAGMSLLDTADGVLMCGAYGWAFAHPLRKVFYNLTITGLSAVVALFIGTVELVSIVAAKSGWTPPAWWAPLLRWDSQAMGYGVVALFLVCWAVSVSIWHFGGFENRWSPAESSADQRGNPRDMR